MDTSKRRVLAFTVKEKEKTLFRELAIKTEMKPSELFRNWLQKELKKAKML